MERQQELNLFTVCRGAAPEIFARELASVLDNICDPNTLATKARTITLQFTFAPFPDRQGATVSLTCKSTLGALDASDVTGNIYVAKRDGRVSAYSHDVRQGGLFDEKPEVAADGKSAGAGDGKVVGIS